MDARINPLAYPKDRGWSQDPRNSRERPRRNVLWVDDAMARVQPIVLWVDDAMAHVEPILLRVDTD